MIGEGLTARADRAYKALTKLHGGEPVPIKTLDALLSDVGTMRLLADRISSELSDMERDVSRLRMSSFSYCHICWTSSYGPCEDSFPGAVPDGRGGWMYCQLCKSREEIARLREIINGSEMAFG